MKAFGFNRIGEHDLVAGSTLTLPCVSVRDHARYLLKHNRWFLHERP